MAVGRDLAPAKNATSSAKRKRVMFGEWVRSLMNRVKSVGAQTLPCGTSEEIGCWVER